MIEYSDLVKNKRNLNNFDAGAADMNVHTPGVNYQFNGLSPADRSLKHGYSLSLACESGTDMLHSIGNITAVMLQFIVDQFPSNTFKTVLPSTKLSNTHP